MNKTFTLIGLLFASLFQCHAQDDMYTDVRKTDSITNEDTNKADNKNIISLIIPQNMKIKDKIFILNKTNTTILQAVVAQVGDDGQQNVLGVSILQYPSQKVTIASFDNNELKQLRGKKIAIKVKGTTEMIGNMNSTSVGAAWGGTGGFGGGGVTVNHRDLDADKINNLDENKITYNYSASIHEEDHDLYITVTHNGLKGEGAFDF